MAASPNLRFQVFRGAELLLERAFQEPSVSIGRSAAALLRVDDASLGELHAVLNVEDDGTVQLLDLGTEAGTLHRGQPISNVVLRSGEDFQLGNIRVVVAFDEKEQTTPTMDVRPVDMPVEDDRTEVQDEEELPILDRLIRESQSTAGLNTKAAKVLEVSHVWGDTLLDSRQFDRKHPVTIGPSFGHKWMLFGNPVGWVPESLSSILSASPPIWSDVQEMWSSDFYVTQDWLPNRDDHVLFQADGRGWTARVATHWDGFADVGDDRLTFDQLVAKGMARKSGEFYEIPVTEDLALAVDIHGVVFFARQTHPTAIAASPVERDYAFLGLSAAGSFLFVMLGLVYQFSPPKTENDMMIPEERLVELMLKEEEPPPPEEKKDDKEKNEDAGEGAKAKEEEGKVGKEEAKLKEAKGEKVASPVQSREVAENAGLLGALNDPSNQLTSGLDASLSSGIGGLIGIAGTQGGFGGLGARGTGFGGGGTANGLGGLGARGSGLGGSGTGKGGGEFGQGGSLGTKGTTTVSASTGEPIILGGLDRSLIDAVIKRKMSQIRYCYQRELQKNPQLNGKLTIKFTIAKDGAVSQAGVKSSSMGNPAVDQCVVQRFYQMQFPEPKGGGIVVVSYPFIFSPG
jgi:TonB family protein